MSFKARYQSQIAPALKDELEITNPMLIPKIEKVVLNMGIGTFIRNGNKDYTNLLNELALIAGQKPVLKNAKKSISNFKLREGMPVGLTVTLRGDRMYSFLEKMVTVVMPRIRDFRGISKKSFDRDGNYNFGVKEHTIFSEIPQNDIVKPHGMQITIVTNSNKEASKAMLDKFGFPFAK